MPPAMLAQAQALHAQIMNLRMMLVLGVNAQLSPAYALRVAELEAQANQLHAMLPPQLQEELRQAQAEQMRESDAAEEQEYWSDVERERYRLDKGTLLVGSHYENNPAVPPSRWSTPDESDDDGAAADGGEGNRQDLPVVFVLHAAARMAMSAARGVVMLSGTPGGRESAEASDLRVSDRGLGCYRP